MSKDELFRILIRGLSAAGSTINVAPEQTNPRLIDITLPDGRRSRTRVYLWECTFDRANNKYHFQLTSVPGQQFLFTRGIQTTVLGYNSTFDAFVAADASKRLTRFGESSSIYTSRESLQAAARDGVAAHTSPRGEILIMTRADMVTSYFASAKQMHDVAREAGILELDDLLNEDNIDPRPRARVSSTTSRLVRAASFRGRVLRAYNNSCAVCGMQLRLVEAAHIVPVDEPLSTDNTDNGIALCRTHHKAYDAFLFSIHDNYGVEVNEARLTELTRRGLAEGIESFRASLPEQIRLPIIEKRYPSPGNLAKGVQIRRVRSR